MLRLSQINPYEMNHKCLNCFEKNVNIALENYQLRLLHQYPMDQDHLSQQRLEET